MNFMRQVNGIIRLLVINNIVRAGVLSLFLTLFLLSYPRSWSLYSLSISLVCGLLLWIMDFKTIKNSFVKNWIYVFPPILYFLIHLISVILQNSSFSLLENRLMFLLIPVFGFPLLISDYLRNNIETSFKVLIAGLVSISIFLLIRIIIIIMKEAVDVSIAEYIQENNDKIFSLGFSILEHPSYLSLKINSAILILIFFFRKWKIKLFAVCLSLLLFSVMIFLLASKAGIIIYLIVLVTSSIFKFSKETSYRKVIYFILIPVFIITSFLIAKRIDRIEWFIHYTELGINSEEIDFKNIDQRTREWYCAVQLIKEKPFTGFGLGEVESRMVKEYLKNGFEEEAALKMNAHNQFLEAQMTFGIAGSVSLLLMLLSPLIFRKKLIYPRLATAFILMMSFFLLFESMFNRQWGIMFFLLFYFILALPKQIPEENIKRE